MTCKRLETWELIGTRTSETCEKFWSLALRNYQKKIAIVKSHKPTLTIGLRGSYNNSALSIHKLKFFYQILSFRFIYKWIITFQTWTFSDKISCGSWTFLFTVNGTKELPILLIFPHIHHQYHQRMWVGMRVLRKEK